VSDASKLDAMPIDIKHYLKHCFAWKLRGVAEASLHAAPGTAEASLHTAPGAAEASLHTAPSSILAASTNQAVGASLRAAPSEEASREKDDSNGEASEFVFLKKADEAEREFRAHLQAERLVVSRLRDEAQRLVGHVQSLHVQLRAEHSAVFAIEEEVQVYKTEAASTQQNIAEREEPL